jgi:GNAT superfamily N-acetyltransferase
MATHDVSIRGIQQGDEKKLLEMMYALQSHLERSNPRIWRITDEGRRQILEQVKGAIRSDGKLLVAEIGGKTVGFAAARVSKRADFKPATVGFIERVFMCEEHRRRGIATQLVHAICDYFTENGVEEVNLQYVRGNREAEGFWGSLGFTPVLETASTDLDGLLYKIHSE